jgi:hypothetical protein
MKSGLNHTKDGFIVVLSLVHINAEHLGKLRGLAMMMAAALVNPLTTGWDKKVDHQTPASAPQCKLESPHRQCQQDGVGDVTRAARRGKGFQGGRGHEGYHCHGPVASWRLDPKSAAIMGGRNDA